MALADDFSQTVKRPVVLFDFYLDSGELNFWTGKYDVEWNGKTYSPLPGIDAGISVRQSLEISGLSADLRIAGLQEEIKAIALSENYQNRRAEVWLGNKTEQATISNAETIFVGRIEDMPIILSAGESQLEVTFSSAFADLDRPSDVRYSRADQAQLDVNDTFFDFLEAARNPSVQWAIG